MAEPFRVVPTEDEIDIPQSRSNVLEAAGIQTLMLGLGALSQRTLVAFSKLFGLLTVTSVFWLFFSIKDPNVYQLVLLAMYAGFVLAVNFIVRR